jgi:TonB-linked SusC/RagA family outer membrane protein
MRTLLVCVLALVCTTAAWAQKPKGREVTGVVVDVEGAPVAGATVSIAGGATATTAADGTFKLSGVDVAAVSVDVAAEGFDARKVAVAAGKTALQLQVVLVRPPPPEPPPTRTITGVVVGADLRPVSGATVQVRGGALAAVTEADGTFAIAGATTADVVLDVIATGLEPGAIEVPADKSTVLIALAGGAPVDTPPPTESRILRGVVKETDTGEPIIGATVIIPGTPYSAITDVDGSFVIEGVPEGPLTVEVAASFHETAVTELGPEQDTLDVGLALTEGEQIIIVGRAPVIVKQNLAGGASVVDGEDLTRVTAQTVDGALQGKVAGSNVQFNSGAPGGGAQVRLRGISTINGQSSPLFVIDGVIISNVSVPSGANAITAAAAGGSASNQDNPVNRIADLNPNDIENVEILKGASAAALYGSKAANGVVIITTKRGRAGENRVNVTQRFGFAMLANKLGSRQYDSVEDVMAAYGPTSPLVQAFEDADGQTFDHEEEMTETKLASETIASASGGTENGSYYGSVLLRDEPGIVIGTYYEKQTGRFALGYELWDRLQLGVTANVMHTESDRGLTNNDNTGTSNYVVLSGTPNFVDLRPSGGVYPANPAVGSGTNPNQTVALLSNAEDVTRLITGANATLEAWKNETSKVSAFGNVGVDTFDQKNNLLSPNELIYEPTDGLPGTSIDATTTNLNFNIGVGALWALTPKSGTFRNALSAGVTYESVDLSSVYVIAQNLVAGQPNVDSGTAVNIQHTRLRTKDQGLFLQEEVALLDDTLSILGGLLAERSSLNGDPAKYYLFPKLAAVYELAVPEEQFDVARVRVAYGEAGNRPNYGQRFTALDATDTIDGLPGLTIIGTAGDPDIEPERQREFELGVDAATKNQRGVAELTFYHRGISNLLLQRAVNPSSGFTTQFMNGGSMRNVGIEAAVQAVPVAGQVEWTTRAILTLNRSKVTDLPDDVPAFDVTTVGFGAGLGAYRIEEGKSATQIVGLDADGQYVVLGNGEPDFRVGWYNEVRTGQLTLGALIDWQQGSDVINLTRLLYDFGNNSPDAEAAAERLAAFSAGDMGPYVEDASFVKLREVVVTYDVPEDIAKNIGPLDSLQVSLSGRNLATFTGYSGLDPEVSNFGNQPIGRNYDVAPYPPSRSFWLSVTAGL